MGRGSGHRRSEKQRYQGHAQTVQYQHSIPGLAHVPFSALEEDVGVWDLNGSREEVLASFDGLIYKIRKWNYRKGIRVDVSTLFGKPRHVFTTPEKGTFYAVLKLDGDAITFVNKGRSFWFQGICVGDEAFEFAEADGKEYMDHPRHNAMSFGGNHFEISAGRPSVLATGVPSVRKAFKGLLTSRGRLNRIRWGAFVLHLCEAPKNEVVFQHLRTAMVPESEWPTCTDDLTQSEKYDRIDALIHGWNKLTQSEKYDRIDALIHGWKKLSQFIMQCLNCIRDGAPLPELPKNPCFEGLNSVQDAMKIVRILHIDAQNEGLFRHDPLQLPDKWSASPDVLAIRRGNIDKKQKRRGHKRMRTQDAPEPNIPDSICPLPDELFHTLHIDGEVKSLLIDQSPVSRANLSPHGWVSTKFERRSPNHISTRNMSTGSYDTELWCPKGFTLDITSEIISDIRMANRTIRPHSSSNAKAHNHQLDVLKTKSANLKLFHCDQDNIKDFNSKGTRIIREGLAQSRRVRPIFVVGMTKISGGTCAFWPQISGGTNKFQVQQLILSPPGSPPRYTADCPGKHNIKKRKSRSWRLFPCDRSPEDNIRDFNSKGTRIIRRVRPIFGIKARSIMVGMGVIQTCAIWPEISSVNNGQADEVILRQRGSAPRYTTDCPGKRDIRKPSSGINSSKVHVLQRCQTMKHTPAAIDAYGGSFVQQIALRLRGGDLRSTPLAKITDTKGCMQGKTWRLSLWGHQS